MHPKQKQLHVATSPLTGTIHAGTILQDGHTWGANKQDVTMETIIAVAEHVLRKGGAQRSNKPDAEIRKYIEITDSGGTPEYRIIVEKL